MGDIELAVEECGFSEQGIFRARFVAVGNVAYAFEPNELDDSRPVRKKRGEPPAGPFAVGGIRYDSSPQLDIRHGAVDFAYLVGLAAVDIFIRVIVQQVELGEYLQFFVEEFGAFGAYSREVLYVQSG